MAGSRIDIDAFSALLESVYESAADPDQWRVFLQGLAGALNAKSGLFRVVDERLSAVRANVHFNLDPDLQEAYRRYYVAQDPVVEALKHKPDVYIAPGEAFLDTKELRATEFFADYARPQDNVYLCGGLAMRNEELTIKFGVQRDLRTGPFSREDAAFIRRFVPHIQRAARLGHMLDLTRHQTASAEQALESMAVGVILLDEQGGILHTNSKADSLLRNRCGLTSLRGRLATTSSADAGPLRDLLAAAGSRAEPGAPPVPETLLLTPGPDEPQLLVVASPTPPSRPGFRGPWPQATVALFVSNLADAGLLNHEILMSLWDLTPSEARLAGALSQGHDLASLSEQWGTSRETLRTHLKRVLGKTGTSRQAELIRLLSGKPWSLIGQPGPLAGLG